MMLITADKKIVYSALGAESKIGLAVRGEWVARDGAIIGKVRNLSGQTPDEGAEHVLTAGLVPTMRAEGCELVSAPDAEAAMAVFVAAHDAEIDEAQRMREARQMVLDAGLTPGGDDPIEPTPPVRYLSNTGTVVKTKPSQVIRDV